MERSSCDQLEVSVLKTHRLHIYTEMFAKLQRILVQARSESPYWSAARCRGILCDLQRVIGAVYRRLYDTHVPYTAWDLSFASVIHPLWDVVCNEEGEKQMELNIRVWRARYYVDALTPLLSAARTIANLTDVMNQLDEGSAETDDPNPCCFTWRESLL